MVRSIRWTTYAFVVCLVLGNLAAVGLLTFTSRDNRARLDVIVADDRRLETSITPLGGLIKDIQLDIVQVQQFLTDYSATRGEDGLDDGLKEAAEFAAKFAKDTAAATRIAEAEGRADIVAVLKDAATAFGPYRDIGEQMARTYATKGTTAGNDMMPEFDLRSEALQKKLDELLTIRDTMLTDVADHMKAHVDAVIDGQERATRSTFAVVGLLTVVSVLFGLVLVRRVVQPVTTLAETMRSLADDRRSVDVPFQGRRDEIGRMAQATEVFRRAIEENDTLQRHRLDEEERSRETHRRERLALADDFAERVAAVVEGLGETAERIGRDARAVDTIARGTAGLTDETARAMSRTDANVAAMAAAADTLTRAIGDVESRMHQAETISAAAAEQAGRTNAIVHELADSTSRIGEIVGLINAVAAQTNLLALNATIEAARAGDAGRGFAIVAQEVKQLAAETSKATDEIARQIDAVQSVTGTAVTAINSITETVGSVGGILHAITEAVGEQSTATREIARSIAATNRETGAVATNIRAVDGSTRDTTTAAVSMVDASGELDVVARRLRDEATAFVARIRA